MFNKCVSSTQLIANPEISSQGSGSSETARGHLGHHPVLGTQGVEGRQSSRLSGEAAEGELGPRGEQQVCSEREVSSRPCTV